MKRILCALILILLISGCSYNNKVGEPTHTPSTIPTENPFVEEEIVKDEYLIQPLLNSYGFGFGDTNGYQTYDLSVDNYVVSYNQEYRVINKENQYVTDKGCYLIPSVWDGVKLYTENYSDVENSKLIKPGGDGDYGAPKVYLVYDEENKKVKMYRSSDGLYMLEDFDSDNCEQKKLLKYTSIYNVVRTVDESDWYSDEFDQSDKKGVMDGKGNILTQCIYDDVFDIEGELIPVKKDGLWGYVDIDGKEVIPCIYQGTFNYEYGKLETGEYGNVLNYYPYPVIDGRIVVKNQDDKYGVIDTSGNVLIEFEYDYGSPYYDNSVILKKDGEWIVK